jgi:uncharacterized protein YggU (UPF0235/DUF167 family)
VWESLPVFYEKEKAFLRIRVIPHASLARVGDVRIGPCGETYLTLYVTAPPIDGKANKAIITLLSQHLNIPKRCIAIQKGTAKRYKIIALTLQP